MVVTYHVHAIGDPMWYRTMYAESLESMRAVKGMNLVDELQGDPTSEGGLKTL